MIEQHRLKSVLLPDAINLKRPELAKDYAKARVKVTGKTPGTFIVKQGTPMVYGLTIPRNAPNPAARFRTIPKTMISEVEKPNVPWA